MIQTIRRSVWLSVGSQSACNVCIMRPPNLLINRGGNTAGARLGPDGSCLDVALASAWAWLSCIPAKLVSAGNVELQLSPVMPHS